MMSSPCNLEQVTERLLAFPGLACYFVQGKHSINIYWMTQIPPEVFHLSNQKPVTELCYWTNYTVNPNILIKMLIQSQEPREG